jgi:hypothetical protein
MISYLFGREEHEMLRVRSSSVTGIVLQRHALGLLTIALTSTISWQMSLGQEEVYTTSL